MRLQCGLRSVFFIPSFGVASFFDNVFTYPVIQFDGFVAFLVRSSQSKRNEITNTKPHSHCQNNCYKAHLHHMGASMWYDGQNRMCQNFLQFILFFSFSPSINRMVYVNDAAIRPQRKYSRNYSGRVLQMANKNTFDDGKILHFLRLESHFQFIRMSRVRRHNPMYCKNNTFWILITTPLSFDTCNILAFSVTFIHVGQPPPTKRQLCTWHATQPHQWIISKIPILSANYWCIFEIGQIYSF